MVMGSVIHFLIQQFDILIRASQAGFDGQEAWHSQSGSRTSNEICLGQDAKETTEHGKFI